MFIIEEARKEQRKLRAMIYGPSGSGKTYSSLLLAKGLVNGDCDKICIVDTEKSGSLYDDIVPTKIINFTNNYTPDRYIQAVETAIDAGHECVIIDSLSPMWGVTLDINANIAETKYKGDVFRSWRDTNKIINKFYEFAFKCGIHLICTIRSKTDWVITTDNNGRKTYKGTSGIDFRDNIEYEFDLSLQLEANHLTFVSKDRTNLFNSEMPFIITDETGIILRKWCDRGISKIEILKERLLRCAKIGLESKLINQEKMDSITANIDNYTIEDLEKSINYFDSKLR